MLFLTIDTEEWTLITLHTPLTPRSGHASMIREGTLFIYGGELHNDEEGYSNANDLWSWNIGKRKGVKY